MPYDVLMPQLGMTMTEGSVLHWLKKPGEEVKKGECLFVVETDKVEMEVEATCSGTVTELLVETGTVVPVGTVIGRIELDGTVEVGQTSNVFANQASAPVPVSAKTMDVITPVPDPDPFLSKRTDLQNRASPRAKKLARELGVELREVPDHTGKGRVVEADVQQFWRDRAAPSASSSSKPSSQALTDKKASSAARKTVAARMTASVQTIPHFYLDVLADATELIKLRDGLVVYVERRNGVRLTYTDLLLKALAVALVKHPAFNCYWEFEGVKRRDRINLGFAVQANNQLLVPVVQNADKLSLADLAKTRSDLVTRAQTNKLRMGDLEGASCTLSNLGAYGIDHFYPIINPPESAILATGRIAARPMVEGESVVARQTISLSLAVDHRLNDGVEAAAFLITLANAVESPYSLLLD